MAVDPASVYTLRIKRVYLDRIKTGEKVKEYRDFKPSYSGLNRPGLRYIRFHYQGAETILVEIKGIEVIATPERLRASGIPFGPQVYEISLGRLVPE